MCGIGGYVDSQGLLDGGRVLGALAAALSHRGPDGEGFFRQGNIGFVHRRLAIIDLSEGGAQPMTIGAVTVVFNGEIYNYRELRDELRVAGETFVTSSDTEVLVRAYLHWGLSFTERLRGMWAFALADGRSQTLLCARDPFGIKPLYFASYQGAFLFASEPQALIRAGVPPRANYDIAAQYLALGVTEHEPACFFAGITPLRAGASLMVDSNGGLRHLPGPGLDALARGARTSATDFARALKESVDLHLRSDRAGGNLPLGGP